MRLGIIRRSGSNHAGLPFLRGKGAAVLALALLLAISFCILPGQAARASTIIEDGIITISDDFVGDQPGGQADESRYAAVESAVGIGPTAEASWPVTIVVTAGGDTTLGCTERQSAMKEGFTNVVAEKGYSWPLSALADILSADDLTLVNFEGTLTESKEAQQKTYNFKGPAEYVNILTAGSVEAVNLANNHFHDYGNKGKEDTKAALDGAGIVYCGAGFTGVYEVKGVKIGLIGNTFPYAKGKRDIRKDVTALRKSGCQIVIASFHWGSEYEAAFSSEQRAIGRAAIDAGADVVIGHHPHIVQGIELYKGRYILYSLGNLMFGGNTDPDDRDSYLARLTFTVTEEGSEPPAFEMIPIRLTEQAKGTDYRPVPAYGAEAERIRDRVLKRSREVDSIGIAADY